MQMIRVVELKPLEGARLWVRFSDGVEGVFAVEPDRRGGVFERLADPLVFNQVTIDEDFGCVEWPGGVDVCPTAMHEEVVQENAVVELKEEELTRS
jgi:hypothetical protein